MKCTKNYNLRIAIVLLIKPSNLFSDVPVSVAVVVFLGTVYTDAVSFVTASVSMRLHLSFTRRRFDFVIRTGSFSKRFQKWSIFKTVWLHWSCNRRNRIDLKRAGVSFSMRFPGHETVSIGNRVRVNAALNSLLNCFFQFHGFFLLLFSSY